MSSPRLVIEDDKLPEPVLPSLLVPSKFRRGGFGFNTRVRISDRALFNEMRTFADEQVAKLKKIRKSNKHYNEIYNGLRDALLHKLRDVVNRQHLLNIRQGQQKRRQKERRIAADFNRQVEQNILIKEEKKAEKNVNNIVPLFYKTGLKNDYSPDKDSDLSVDVVRKIKDEKIPAVRILLSANGENVLDEEVAFRTFNRKDIWESGIRPVLIRYEGDIFYINPKTGAGYEDGTTLSLTLIRPTTVSAKKLYQRFLDGTDFHCVCDPIINRCMEELKNTEMATRTRNRWLKKLKDAERWKRDNPNGIDEDQMEQFANELDIKIVIRGVFGREDNVFNGGGGKGKACFSYSNLRANHLEAGLVTMNAEKVDFETLNTMIDKRRESGEPLLTKKRKVNVNGCQEKVATSIYTPGGSFKVEDPFHTLFDKFREETTIKQRGLNGGRHPEIYDFIREAIVVNSTPMAIWGGEADGLLDMKSAYTQHRACPYYQGFMGKIHTAGRVPWEHVNTKEKARAFLKKHLGIVEFRVWKCDNKLLELLGIQHKDYLVRPTPEALMLLDMGCDILITHGVFGKRFDFDYKKEWLEPFGQKEDWFYKKKPYAHFAGMLGADARQETFYLEPVNDEWMRHIMSNAGDNARIWRFNQDKLVSIIQRSEFTSMAHIFSFILSYTRINMIQAMTKFELHNIVGVVLDGIYYRGVAPDVGEIFREKPVEEIEWRGDAWYNSTYNDFNIHWGTIDISLLDNVLLRGSGGSGKTYSVMTDKTKIDVLYVSPTCALRDDIKEKYGATAITLNRLIGEGCKPGEDWKSMFGEPANILIDELTMIKKEYIVKALEMYPNSLIMLAGDVCGKQHYQCRNGRPGKFDEIYYAEDWVAKDFTTDYRSKCDKLKAMKIRIREIMDQVFSVMGGDYRAAINVGALFMNEFPIIEYAEAVKMFKEGDYWIAGTHAVGKKLFEDGVKSIDAVDERGSITTHASQGKTIADKRIFITVNDAFEYAQLYTAVSRAVTLDQIVLVKRH